jgi:hypothetical protein
MFRCYFPSFVFLSTGVACAGGPVLYVVSLVLAQGMLLRVKAHAVVPRVKAHAAVPRVKAHAAVLPVASWLVGTTGAVFLLFLSSSPPSCAGMRCPRPGLVSAVQVAFVQLAFASFGFGRFCTSPSLPADGSRWVLYFAACVAVVIFIVLGDCVSFVASKVVIGGVRFIVGGFGACCEAVCVLCAFVCSFVSFVASAVAVGGGLSPALLKKSQVFRLFPWS